MEAKYARALRLLLLAVVEAVVVAGVVVAGVVTAVVLGVEEVNGVNELLPAPRIEELPLLVLETAVGKVLIAPALPNRPPTVLVLPVLLLEPVCCSTRRRTSAGPNWRQLVPTFYRNRFDALYNKEFACTCSVAR